MACIHAADFVVVVVALVVEGVLGLPVGRCSRGLRALLHTDNVLRRAAHQRPRKHFPVRAFVVTSRVTEGLIAHRREHRLLVALASDLQG